jgi:hypothetical protein
MIIIQLADFFIHFIEHLSFQIIIISHIRNQFKLQVKVHGTLMHEFFNVLSCQNKTT